MPSTTASGHSPPSAASNIATTLSGQYGTTIASAPNSTEAQMILLYMKCHLRTSTNRSSKILTGKWKYSVLNESPSGASMPETSPMSPPAMPESTSASPTPAGVADGIRPEKEPPPSPSTV